MLTAREILEWNMEGTPRPAKPLLVVDRLVKWYAPRRCMLQPAGNDIQAVDGVSFTLREGETLGIVGESGCGKTTLARLLMHLIDPDEGTITLDGHAVGRELSLKAFRGSVQMVFQDACSALDPRLTAEAAIAVVLRAHGRGGADALRHARRLLDEVGLAVDRVGACYPRQLSGSERLRVNIARAIALQPRILVLDDVGAGLVSTEADDILDLLRRLKAELELSYVFFGADIEVVRRMSDRMLVMHRGRVVEIGDTPAADRQTDVASLPQPPQSPLAAVRSA